MANNLFTLFDDKLKSENDLIASEKQTLETISSVDEEQDFLLQKVKSLNELELKIDYSDFSNFVFFNSALDYFNITGEKILNEYPYDASLKLSEDFLSDLDGYQHHVINSWPKSVGHLRFETDVSQSYISVEDIGTEDNTSRSAILSPGSSSFSIEGWYNPGLHISGTENVQILVQKISGSNENGYTVYLTGSEVRFKVTSGSVNQEVATQFSTGSINQYFSCVYDRSSYTGSIIIMTGSDTEFPVVAQSASVNIFSPIDLGNVNFYIGSGTLSGKTTDFFTGSLDDIIFWKKARSLSDVSSSFNVKHFSEKNLVGLWRFNETGSLGLGENEIVLDYSGCKLNGRIQNYFNNIRGSGSLLIQETPDIIANYNVPAVQEFILEQQNSGSLYDKYNDNIITTLFPESFIKLENDVNTTILKDFSYVLARQYDIIKLHADQFSNILKVDYGKFNQTPDALLDVVAKFFGWEFTGNFLNSEVFQYILGKNILKNVNTNEQIEKKLFEIKNEFWKRTIINLIHLYKTKGTRESIESFLRLYGVNKNFVRLKEFGYMPNSKIVSNRIKAEKSVYVFGFGSGSITSSISLYKNTATTPFFNVTSSYSIESRVMFPLTSSINIAATQLSGTIWSKSVEDSFLRLQYKKDAVNSHTGTLYLSSSDNKNALTMSNANIFDNKWHNIVVAYDNITSSLYIDVKSIDDGNITKNLNVKLKNVTEGIVTSSFDTITLGSSASLSAEYWTQEFRVWDKPLTNSELDDHVLNFQSYGLQNPISNEGSLLLHWRLRENLTSSISGEGIIEDVSLNSFSGSLFGLSSNFNVYKKFLNEYNYLTSLDFGWNENRIQSFDATSVSREQFVNDNRLLSLEFNYVDALNEDLVQLIDSLDKFNNIIGQPANKYRAEYDDLRSLRRIYFQRLQGQLNFRLFADFLDFFDRSFIDMVRRLIPSRAIFMGDEFIIESHMLERPKVVYEVRKVQEKPIIIEGKVEAWTR